MGDDKLTLAERQQLVTIADALERKVAVDVDEALVAQLIKKCMIRTNGKSFKVTEIGLRELAQ